MKRGFFLFLLAGCMLFLPVCAKRWTQGFRIAKIQLDLPFHPEWEVAKIDHLDQILSQPYSYLSKGAQCYVFVSQDGQYVLKLFRFDPHLNPLRSFFRTVFKKKKIRTPFEAKVLRVFNACKLAFEMAPEETGLIYIHLNPTSDKLPPLLCKDPIGRSCRIPLESARFALQKRAQPFRKTFLDAIKSGDPAQVETRIDEFLALLRSRTGKGIGNSDPNLSRNFGFLEDQAVEFDFGNYSYSPAMLQPASQRREIEHYANRLRRWLKRTAPEWIPYLDEKLTTEKK